MNRYDSQEEAFAVGFLRGKEMAFREVFKEVGCRTGLINFLSDWRLKGTPEEVLERLKACFEKWVEAEFHWEEEKQKIMTMLEKS